MFGALAAVVGLVIGVASAVAQPAPPKAANAKTVGVVSAIGETFTLQKIGITVFGNESHNVAIGAWGIDDLVAARVSAALSKRFHVKRISVPKGAFASYESPGGMFRDRDAELREIVRKLASSQPCDLYVVVTKGYSPFGTTNQAAIGLGLVVAASALIDNSHLYALSTIRIYDGKTFAVLRSQHASMGQPTFMKTIKGPYREVDSSWWPSGQAASDARLREATRKLVEQSITMSIPALMQLD